MFTRFHKRKNDIFTLIKLNKLRKIKELHNEETKFLYNDENRNVISYAIIEEKESIVEFFYDNGHKISREIDGINTIHYLIDNDSKNYSLIRFILSTGFGVNGLHEGMTPLARCMTKKKTDFKLVLLLLEMGADVNKASRYCLTPLTLLIENSEKSTAEKLELMYLFESKNLVFRSDFQTINNTKRVNLYAMALKKRQYSIFIQLLKLCKNIEKEELQEIKKFLVPGVMDSLFQHEVVELSQKYNLGIYFPASFYDYAALVNQLHIRNNNDMAAPNFILHVCIHRQLSMIQKRELINIYLKNGGSIHECKEIQGHQFNLLSYLICFFQDVEKGLQLVEFLLEKGAYIEDNTSALFDALWFGKIEYLGLLLEHHADIFYVTHNKETIFSKLSLPTIQGDVVSLKKCFVMQKLIYNSIKDTSKKKKIMRMPYCISNSQNTKTNPLNFYLQNNQNNIEENVINYYLENGFSITDCQEYELLDFDILRDILLSNNHKFIFSMFDKYPNMNNRTQNKYSYIKELFLKNDYEIIEVFFKWVADINCIFFINGRATTLLEQAIICSNGNFEIVNYILDNFKEVDVTFVGEYPILIHLFRRKASLELMGKVISKMECLNDTFTIQLSKECLPSDIPMLAYILSNQPFIKGEKILSETQLYEYIYAVAKMMITAGCNINASFHILREKRKYSFGIEKEEFSILELAVTLDTYYHETELIELLLQSGADITLTTGVYKTRIEHMITIYDSFDGIEQQRIEFLQLLKKYRPEQFDLNIQTNMGANTVIGAVQHCHPKLVKWLIDNGADPFVIGGNTNTNALDKAISTWPQHPPFERVKTVEVLLNAGLDIEIRNLENLTPLHISAQVGALDVVECLLKRGANVNAITAQGENAICFAVTGASDFQFTRSHKMNENNKARIIKLLHRYGCNINHVSKEGLTPLGYAIYFRYNEIMASLLTLDVDVNLKDSHGLTPLMRAFECENYFAINTLLKHPKIDLHKVDHNGQNILFYIARNDDSQENTSLFLEMIRDKHVHVEKSNSKETPLSYCVEGKYYLTKAIIDYIDDINYEDGRGATPLFIAAGFYHESREQFDFLQQKTIINLLIENGANINHINMEGTSILDIANRLQHDELREFLITNGAGVTNQKSLLS